MDGKNIKSICIVTPLFPPEIGGPATYVPELSKHLTALGYKIRIVALAEKHPTEKYGLEVYSILKRSFIAERELRLLKSIIDLSRKSDVIYALDVAAIGLQCVLASKLLNKPVVLRYVGDTAWEKAQREGKTRKSLEEFLRAPDANKGILKIQAFVISNSSRIIVASNFLKRLLVTYYHVNPAKVIVIPNAVDERAFLESKSKNRKMLRLKGPTVVTVCRLTPWKGVDGIIHAINEVRKKIPAVKLLVIGEGPLEDELKHLVHTLNLERNVKFLGRMSKEKTLQHVSASDVFVLNSRYEGMAHVILEAMACGTPVVASDIEPNREVIGSSSGMLVSVGSDNVQYLSSAIYHFIKSPLVSKRIVHRASRNIKKYIWENTLTQFIHAMNR